MLNANAVPSVPNNMKSFIHWPHVKACVATV